MTDNRHYENENGGNMGGGWFGGSGMIMVLFALVVFWLIFERRDGNRGGYGDYGHGGFGCGPCVRPAFIDESNFEEERNLKSDYCNKTDKILESEEKTRALVEGNYVKELERKLVERDTIIATQRSEAFTAAQIGGVKAEVGGIYREIERLACELPKRPPVFSTCSVPCNQEIVTGCGCGPRRGRCDEFDAA